MNYELLNSELLLLHWPGFSVFQALVDDGLDLGVGFAGDAALFCAETPLFGSQSALLLTKQSLLAAEFALPGAHLALQSAQLTLEFADLAPAVRRVDQW